MKNKASSAVKNVFSVLTSMVKSKIMGVKSKADAIRVRLAVFSLLKSKKFSLGSLSSKFQTFLDKKRYEDDDNASNMQDESKAIILYGADASAGAGAGAGGTDQSNMDYNSKEYPQILQLGYYDYENDDERYPDLTHCMFDEEEDLGEDQGSAIDIVKNSKEQDGEEFVLEDEINNVADLFIRRFKKHVRLEKLESFKRYQAMIGRSA